MTGRSTRWLFGDQLGPHFAEDADRFLMIESSAVLARRPYHRLKAHLVLSAMRHRAADLGERVQYLTAVTYGEALARVSDPLSVCDPTSHAARALVRRVPGIDILPARGFVTSQADFATWAAGRSRLLMEDFYRWTRQRTGILMDSGSPAGGAWNFDASNRQPPPRGARTLGLPEPQWPLEDEIDARVREDLDRMAAHGVRFAGRDGVRRFAVTRAEALTALGDFVDHRLGAFGPYEDAALVNDWAMAHSLLSVPLNLGLLHPLEVVGAVVAAYDEGRAPIESVEGFVRQVIGWRDYVWHLYWHLGPDYQRRSNALDAHEPLPEWFDSLDADAVSARCLSEALGSVRDTGWTHHIPRLMVLGNWALQRGYDPVKTTEWFRTRFVDGFDWVMAANVVGMALHADGGVMATKPYAGGGAYISRMTDYCRGCRYSPTVRVGDSGCPFSAGYWWFLHRTRERLSRNHRMAQPLRGLDRLADLDQLVTQEQSRGASAP